MLSLAGITSKEVSRRAGPLSSPATPMRGFQLVFAVIILSLATFIVILDATIINVAVPHIAGAFAAAPNEGAWVITGYAVAEALTVPLSGWLAARFGLVTTLIISLASFAVFSALCGIAPTLQALVALRVLQGLSGGPLIPISQTLIMKISPPERVEMVMGLWMMTSIIAPIAGPILGGGLADTIGWRWAFYMNIPIASLCAVCAFFIFRAYETTKLRDRMDLIGLSLLIIWVGSFQIMLDTGEDQDWFSSLQIVWLFGISIIGLIVFIIWEITDNHPIVNLRVFQFRGFAVSAAAMFIAFGAFFASLILMPLWLQLGMGYTATLAGYVLAFQGVLGIFVAPIAAVLMGKVDPRFLMSVGLAILSGAIFCRSGFATTIGFNQMLWPQLMMGAGLPISLKDIPASYVASASGVINFLRTLAGAIATSAVIATWSRKTITTHANLISVIKSPIGLLSTFEKMGLGKTQALQSLDNIVLQQSMVLAAGSVSIILSAVIGLTAIGIWLMPAPKKAREGTDSTLC
jgi:DHA2 family multidrug resistance protein